MPELLEVGERFPVDRKCVRRKQPLFFGEEPLLGESGANDLQTVFSGSDHLLKVEHRTSNVQRRIAGYYRRLCVAFDTNALHSPSRGHFLEYELHQFFG